MARSYIDVNDFEKKYRLQSALQRHFFKRMIQRQFAKRKGQVFSFRKSRIKIRIKVISLHVNKRSYLCNTRQKPNALK